MRYYQLLREYNETRLFKDFGSKLISKILTDRTAPVDIRQDWSKYGVTDNNSPEFERNQYQDSVRRSAIKKIASLDPTPNKEFTFWLINNYSNNRIIRYEDISSRAIPTLLKFKALLRKPNLNPPLQIRDINQIKGLTALEDIVDQYDEKDTTSNSYDSAKIEHNFYATNQASLLINNNRIKVLIPKTIEASMFFGKGTRWCTAANNNNAFEHYTVDGPLYIIIIKNSNEKYQVHLESEQFMNSNDDELDSEQILGLLNTYPELLNLFCPSSKPFHNIYLQIASADNKYFLEILAKDKKTPADALNIIAKNKNSTLSTLREVAKHINTSEKTLSFLINKSTTLYSTIAGNQHASAGVLKKVYEKLTYINNMVCTDNNTLDIIVSNINCPIYILKNEATSNYSTIREAVARNAKITPEIFNILSSDWDSDVIVQLINNPEITSDKLLQIYKIQKKLANSNKYIDMHIIYVYRELAKNKKCPTTLLKLFSNTDDLIIKYNVANNTSTSSDILEKLSNNTYDNDILYALADNPNSTEKIKSNVKNTLSGRN